MTAIPDQSIRIDKWLWFARQIKTRSAAQKLVTGGKVRVNRDKIVSASRLVRPGDVVTLALPRGVQVLRIVECGERRGPYPEARLLYEELAGNTPDTAAQETAHGLD